MKPRNLIMAGAAMAVGMLATPMTASASHSWQMIGVQRVDGVRDRDVVRVPGRERFSQIKLCVYRGHVNFRDLDVRFANGRTRDIAVRGYFRPGTCTRAIDLPGYRRNVVSISMNYGTVGAGRFGWRGDRWHQTRHDRRHGRFWRVTRPIVVIYAR